MPGNFKQYDLRIMKTHKALLEALPKLLVRRSFGRITVNDICEESQMSRTAFYSHFNDKYDLLRYWLTKQTPEIMLTKNNYIEIENKINKVIDENREVITNILKDANDETIELINEYITSILIKYIGGSDKKETDLFHIVLHEFCTGGIINFVLWQIKNKFPVRLKMINIHLYEILEVIRKLEKNRLYGGEKNGEQLSR